MSETTTNYDKSTIAEMNNGIILKRARLQGTVLIRARQTLKGKWLKI